MNAQRKPKTAPRVVHDAAEFVAAPAVPKRHRTRWILGDPDADAVEKEVTEHVRKRRGKDATPTAERKAKDVERFELLAKATVKVPTAPTRKIYVDRRDGSIGEMTARDLADKLLEKEAIASEVAEGVRPKTILCAVCKCVVKVKRGNVPRTCAKHSEKKLCPRGCGRAIGVKSKSCTACKTPEEWANLARIRNEKITPEQWSKLARARHEQLGPERRSEIARKRHASLSREQKSAIAQKIRSSRTKEQWAELSRSAMARRTPEQRREAALRANAKLTPEQRSERARKAIAAQTPEQLSAAARKRADAIPRERRSELMRVRMAELTADQRSARAVKAIQTMTPEQRSERMRKAWETRRAKKAASEKAGEE